MIFFDLNVIGRDSHLFVVIEHTSAVPTSVKYSPAVFV